MKLHYFVTALVTLQGREGEADYVGYSSLTLCAKFKKITTTVKVIGRQQFGDFFWPIKRAYCISVLSRDYVARACSLCMTG